MIMSTINISKNKAHKNKTRIYGVTHNPSMQFCSSSLNCCKKQSNAINKSIKKGIILKTEHNLFNRSICHFSWTTINKSASVERSNTVLPIYIDAQELLWFLKKMGSWDCKNWMQNLENAIRTKNITWRLHKHPQHETKSLKTHKYTNIPCNGEINRKLSNPWDQEKLK